MKHVAIVIFVLGLTGCVSEVNEKAGAAVCQVFGAETCQIKEGVSASTDTGSRKTIELALQNMAAVDSSYPQKKITSTAALLMYRGMDEKAKGSYDDVIIDVTNAGVHFTNTYAVDSLALADELLPIPEALFDSQMGHDSVAFVNQMDLNYIPDSVAGGLYHLMGSLVKDFGPINDKMATGFEFMKTKKKRLEVIRIWMEVITGEALTNYEFYVEVATKKIVYVSINQN